MDISSDSSNSAAALADLEQVPESRGIWAGPDGGGCVRDLPLPGGLGDRVGTPGKVVRDSLEYDPVSIPCKVERQRLDGSRIEGPVTPADRVVAKMEVLQGKVERLSADAKAAASDGVISAEERETLMWDVVKLVAELKGVNPEFGGVTGQGGRTPEQWLRDLVTPLPQPQVPSTAQLPGQDQVVEGQGIRAGGGGCILDRDFPAPLPTPAEPGAPSDRVGTWDKSNTGGSRDKGPVTKADKAAAEVLQSSTERLIANAQAAASDGVISENERETLMRDVVKVVAHLKGYGPDVDFIDRSDRTPEDWLRMFTSPPPVCNVPPPSERDDLASKIGDFLRAVPAEDPGTVVKPPLGQIPGPGDVIYDGRGVVEASRSARSAEGARGRRVGGSQRATLE